LMVERLSRFFEKYRSSMVGFSYVDLNLHPFALPNAKRASKAGW